MDRIKCCLCHQWMELNEGDDRHRQSRNCAKNDVNSYKTCGTCSHFEAEQTSIY